MIVRLPAVLREAMVRLARAAAPREACGLLVGVVQEETMTVSGLAPSRNLAREDDAFEIDSALHLALQRRLRGRGESVIGVWHSHTSGAAVPSLRDAAGAWQKGLAWLITAGEETSGWVARGDGFDPVEVLVA